MAIALGEVVDVFLGRHNRLHTPLGINWVLGTALAAAAPGCQRRGAKLPGAAALKRSFRPAFAQLYARAPPRRYPAILRFANYHPNCLSLRCTTRSLRRRVWKSAGSPKPGR